MKNEPLSKKPEFYKSIANNPKIENLDGGSIVGFTNLPIVGVAKTKFNISDLSLNYYRLNHNLGKRYEPFVRVRIEGDEYWQTLPHLEAGIGGPPFEISVQDIGENYIDLVFYTFRFGIYEVEAYFTDFWI